MSVQCFMLRATERERRALRRYVHREGESCAAPYRFHAASTPIGEGVIVRSSDGYMATPQEHDRNDPRWPAKCEHCEYVFRDDDAWQVSGDAIYVDSDGREFSQLDAPPGGIIEAWWLFDPKGPEDLAELPEIRSRYAREPEARMLLSRMYYEQWAETRPPLQVFTPNGRPWIVDSTANNGPGWTVSGDPPLLSCSPSILVPGYHGWLGINGALPGHFSADLDGRGPMGIPA